MQAETSGAKNMKSKHLVLLILLFSLSLETYSASACTIFTATQGETVLFAGNEDQRPNDAYIIVDTSGTYGVVYVARAIASSSETSDMHAHRY